MVASCTFVKTMSLRYAREHLLLAFDEGVDKTWGRPYGLGQGLGHGVGHGLPCGLLYGLPVVRFLRPEHNISKTGTDRLA